MLVLVAAALLVLVLLSLSSSLCVLFAEDVVVRFDYETAQ